MLTTRYDAWIINLAEAFFGQRQAPRVPNEEMGTWVRANITFIERAVGIRPAGSCKKLPG